MPDITPLLWFEGDAEAAAQFYVSIFKNSKITNVSHYGEGGPGPEGTAMMVEFTLDGHDVMALNAPSQEPKPRNDDFQQGKIALFITCETQDMVDDLWDKLSAGGEQLPCGWVQDKYGFAWNIVPEGLGTVLGGPDPQRAQRALQAMLQMRKLDINELRRVYSA
ncbi:MAG TPA: VOC family protein [Verrucomicrobiae bacterium]|nr:VOC family protein [Verrucomicrobiae bacterium]